MERKLFQELGLMKSSSEDLKKRGFITAEDINLFNNHPNKQLYALANSNISVERTVAIHLLSQRLIPYEKSFVKFLLEKLLVEKKFYTKLEICNCLEKGDADTAKQMIEYLGRIGNNQHKRLPKLISKKKSYPLARDIIARTLANMGSEIIPVLIEVLKSQDEIKISEVLDAIGFMLFYNPSYNSETVLKNIIDTMKRYKDKDIIFWKCIICLSAFKTNISIEILQNVLNNNKNDLMKSEAMRSLNLIAMRSERLFE